MKDLRLIKVQERSAQLMGIKETIGVIIGAAILLIISVLVWSKVRNGASVLNGGTYINATTYCSSGGTWNASDCIGGDLLTVPAEYTTETNITSNVLSGFDLAGILPIVLAAGAIIGILFVVFR